jgi:hypothetical protein
MCGHCRRPVRFGLTRVHASLARGLDSELQCSITSHDRLPRLSRNERLLNYKAPLEHSDTAAHSWHSGSRVSTQKVFVLDIARAFSRSVPSQSPDSPSPPQFPISAIPRHACSTPMRGCAEYAPAFGIGCEVRCLCGFLRRTLAICCTRGQHVVFIARYRFSTTTNEQNCAITADHA